MFYYQFVFTSNEQIPLRDFFKNPEKTGYQISPDGRYLSFLAPYQKRLNIFVQELGTKNTKRITAVTDRDIRNYFWKNNTQLLYFRDNNGDENSHVFVVDREGGPVRDLTPFDGVRVGLEDELEDNEQEVLIDMNKRDKKVFDVYRLNVVTGELVLVAQNPGNIVGWLTDHAGKVRVAIATDGVTRSLLFRTTEAEPFKVLLTTHFKESFIPVLFSFDDTFLYAISNINRDKKAIVSFDPVTAQETGVLFEHPEFDAGRLAHSKKRKVLTAALYTSWKTERFFFDDETKKIIEWLEQALPNYEVSIADHNKNEDKFLVRTYSDRSLGAFYLYDLTADTLVKLADVSPWLPEDKLAHMKSISYTSRDGLTLHGYLTLPNGVEPKKLPVVVNPHGGPWARDSWGYNPEVQFLANRGYAVLQMNFRGSTGYGKKFWELSFKQWGKTMQDDISDGVAWLIAQGIANPKRIAIYGGSYGGYATLAGLAFTPELYACGVDYVGVSNLFTFLKTIPEYWKPSLEILYAQVGHPEKDRELLKASSPVFHVDKIRVPLLIAQGRMDPRVNVDESDQVVAALKKKGVDVPYMVKDNEGHGFHNEENRFDFYEAMENFLAKHLQNMTA
ncbi:S9 family peptidase [Candidatus Dependentiae bacterium HGW-Dependentiae-1]|nr:MAG: S9 family peptidase [Candidatus Dependentiae bacterium HGW-Dependentiae-1]